MSQPAFPGPYTDPNLTSRDPAHVAITPTPPYTQNEAQTPVYNPAGHETSGFSHVTAPAQAPNAWVVGRDPYAIGGAAGQSFFNNQA